MIYNLCAVGDDEIDRKKLYIYNKVKDFLREKNEIIFEVDLLIISLVLITSLMLITSIKRMETK